MKKLFAIISAFMLTISSYAQDGNVGEFTVQPMAGISTTSSFVFKYEGMGTMKNKTGLGFTLGADLGYRVSEKFYPTVGLHFIQSRLDFEIESHDGNITANNLAIPVLANFNVSGIRLGIGVQPTFNLGKSTSNNFSGVEESVKSSTIAIPVVVGYELNNGITFEFRAAFDVTNSVDYDKTNVPVYTGYVSKLQSTNLTSMITIGYKFKM